MTAPSDALVSSRKVRSIIRPCADICEARPNFLLALTKARELSAATGEGGGAGVQGVAWVPVKPIVDKVKRKDVKGREGGEGDGEWHLGDSNGEGMAPRGFRGRQPRVSSYRH